MKKFFHVLGILLILGVPFSADGQKRSLEKAGEFSITNDHRAIVNYFDDKHDGLILITERGGSLRLSFGSTAPSVSVTTSVSTEYLIPNTTDHGVSWARPYGGDVLICVYSKYSQNSTNAPRIIRMTRTGSVVFDKTFLPKKSYGDTVWHHYDAPAESYLEGSTLYVCGKYMAYPGGMFGLYTGHIDLEGHTSEVFDGDPLTTEMYKNTAIRLPGNTWVTMFRKDIKDPEFNFTIARVFVFSCYKDGVQLWTDSLYRDSWINFSWFASADEQYVHILLAESRSQYENLVYLKCDTAGVKKKVERLMDVGISGHGYFDKLVCFSDELVLFTSNQLHGSQAVMSFSPETLDTLWSQIIPYHELNNLRINSDGSYLCVYKTYDMPTEIETAYFVTFNARPSSPEPKAYLSGDSIFLHWTSPLTGGYAIEGYRVESMKQGDTCWTSQEITDTSLIFVSNLSAGDSTTHYFRVSAFNKLGVGIAGVTSVDYRKKPPVKPNSVSFVSPDAFKFYPNPSTGKFFIESDYSGTVEFVSLDGKRIASHAITQGTTEVTLSIAPGMYMYIIATSDGHSVGKIVLK